MYETPMFEEPLCAEGLDHLFYDPDDDDDTLIGLPSDRLTKAEREALARRVCGGCKHIVECALHGLKHERHGVWGGLSEADRDGLGGMSVSNGCREDLAIKRMLRSLHPNAVKAILFLWRAQQEFERANEEEVA